MQIKIYIYVIPDFNYYYYYLKSKNEEAAISDNKIFIIHCILYKICIDDSIFQHAPQNILM